MSGDVVAVKEVSPGYGLKSARSALPNGYKKTEAGIIPEDWAISTVGAQFSVQLGKMLDSKKNVGEQKPYLGNRAVQWNRIDTTELPTVPMTQGDLQKFRLETGDILVCEGGEVGRAAIWDAPLHECYYQKALHRLRPINGFNGKLMVAILQQLSNNGILKNYVTQTSIAHLPRDKFLTVPIPIPPQNEQRAIATALSDVDALLEELDRLIAKKRDLKQATMHQLLTGQTRLPGFEGEWNIKRIGEVLEVRHGRDQKEVETPDGQYPILASGGEIGRSNTFLYDKPSVLIGRKGTIDAPRYMNQPFWTVDTLFYTELIGNNSAKFMYYKFCMIPWRNYNEASGVPSLSAKTIEKIEIAAPSPEGQSAIADVLSDFDNDLQVLEQRRTKIASIKQAMMQELLTGRTRLL